MGLGMATNLQKHMIAHSLEPILYTNRTLSKGESLKALGATPYTSIAELVQNSDVIFASIADDAVLLSLVDSFLASGDVAGKILADTSTVHPSTTTIAAEKLSDAGAIFLATPVFGASPAAAAGTVLFAAAGPTKFMETITPYLEAMGRKILHVGTDPSKALLLKTTSNFLMAGLMELVAEAHVLAEKTGLGSAPLEELLKENFGPVIHTDSIRMTTGVYAPPKGEMPWSEVSLAIKDVGHGVKMAKEHGFKLPAGELALDHLREAKAWGDREGRTLDSTSIYGIVREEAGLDFETDFVKRKCESSTSA
jgi:3-hydroxyisobutyrate dehydrogenase-like beta-hydroxyacid dehydrogenase